MEKCQFHPHYWQSMQNHLILIFPLDLPHVLEIHPASEEYMQNKYTVIF